VSFEKSLYGSHHSIALVLKLLFTCTVLCASHFDPKYRPSAGGTDGDSPFQSVTLTDQQFLIGEKDGKFMTLADVHQLPRAKNWRLPVVILIHGSGGINGGITDRKHDLNDMGVATFIRDSFTGKALFLHWTSSPFSADWWWSSMPIVRSSYSPSIRESTLCGLLSWAFHGVAKLSSLRVWSAVSVCMVWPT